ncbi:MAG: hypothetical protein A2X59_11640 [Nitrospirae bacterium GWC2_42_7]|nr:MAG: hypothetical protein A2X59_11640 [Nitrospirae bacterium GWC2_42_7]
MEWRADLKTRQIQACYVLNKYLGPSKDANLGFVDASIMAIAERLKVKKIFTTDRRHFSILKPKHCKSFTLVP